MHPGSDGVSLQFMENGERERAYGDEEDDGSVGAPEEVRETGTKVFDDGDGAVGGGSVLVNYGAGGDGCGDGETDDAREETGSENRTRVEGETHLGRYEEGRGMKVKKKKDQDVGTLTLLISVPLLLLMILLLRIE